jgi:hypothetical protein
MSSRSSLWFPLVGLTLLALTSDAPAQTPNPYANLPAAPTVSPYLQLLSRDNFGIVPYQTQVRPQLQTQGRLNEQQQSLSNLQREFRGVEAMSAARTGATRIGSTGLRGAGRVPRFFNWSHYYALRSPYSR